MLGMSLSAPRHNHLPRVWHDHLARGQLTHRSSCRATSPCARTRNRSGGRLAPAYSSLQAYHARAGLASWPGPHLSSTVRPRLGSPPIRHRLVPFTVFVLLGALLNVIVAWGSAVLVPVGTLPTRY